MKKRSLFALFLAFFSTLILAQNTNTKGKFQDQINGNRPNIVFILAEDLGPRFGVYGDPIAKTPNIDALANEGVVFTNAYTMAGVCSPARAGLITGMYPNFTGLQHMRTGTFLEGGYAGVPPSHVKGYPELLRKSGYFTYNDTKADYQFVNPGGMTEMGPFSLWTEHGEYFKREDMLVPAAWRNFDLRGKPFFLNLNPQITHETGLFRTETADGKFQGLIDSWDAIRALYNYIPTDPNSVILDPYFVDSPKTRKDLALFYDNIYIMDKQVGEIIRKLKEDGLWENTIVVFSTDHGDCLPRHKREGYASGTKVPFIVRVPKKYRPTWIGKPGSFNDRLISFEDLAPTFLGFSGSPIPDHMHGIDLSVNKPRERKYTYVARGRMDAPDLSSYFVTSKKYQYVRNTSTTPNGVTIDFRNTLGVAQSLNELHLEGLLSPEQEAWYKERPIEEFYDLKADPFQLNNLAKDQKQATVMNEYREALDQWRDTGNDMNLIPEATMVKDLLDENGKQRVTLPPVAVQDLISNKIYISNRTENASIGYSFDGKTWEVYNTSFVVPKNIKSVTVKAVRYGWRESETTEIKVN